MYEQCGDSSRHDFADKIGDCIARAESRKVEAPDTAPVRLNQLVVRLNTIVRDYRIMRQIFQPPEHATHLIVSRLMTLLNLTRIDDVVPVIQEKLRLPVSDRGSV